MIEPLDLPLAGCVDLLREARGRHFTEHFWGVADPGVRRADGERPRRQDVHERRHRIGEHQRAGLVEVPREDRHHVGEPRRERAELLRAQSDPSVHRRGVGTGDVVGDPSSGGRRDAADGLHRFGRELGAHLAYDLDAVHVVGEAAETHQPVGEEHVAHGQQEQGIGARHDRHPLVSDLRGAGTHRIDHDRATPAFSDPFDLAEHVGEGEDAAHRLRRVGAHHEEVVRAGDVRHGDLPRIAVHQTAADVLRLLIDGRRPVAGDLRQPGERRHVPAQRRAATDGVARAQRQRTPTVAGDDPVQDLLRAGEGVVPRRGLQHPVRIAYQRRAQAVRVVVQAPERGPLRAQVAFAPHVVLVGTDAGDLPVLHSHLDPAHRLAQVARPQVQRGLAHQ